MLQKYQPELDLTLIATTGSMNKSWFYKQLLIPDDLSQDDSIQYEFNLDNSNKENV